MTDTAGMDRLLIVLVPLLVALGLLAFEAYPGQLDVETCAIQEYPVAES